jgi:hypothetical protein
MLPTAADTAGVQGSLKPWLLAIRGYSALGAGSAPSRLFAEEANNDGAA